MQATLEVIVKKVGRWRYRAERRKRPDPGTCYPDSWAVLANMTYY